MNSKWSHSKLTRLIKSKQHFPQGPGPPLPERTLFVLGAAPAASRQIVVLRREAGPVTTWRLQEATATATRRYSTQFLHSMLRFRQQRGQVIAQGLWIFDWKRN